MITVAPAFAHVDSSTSDGIALLRRLQPGVRPEMDPPEDRVEHPCRSCVVERLPEQHRHHRRNHDREVRERAVQAAPRRSSLISTAAMSGIGYPKIRRQQREVRGVLDGDRQHRVVQHRAEVVETHPGRRLHEVRVLQRHDHRADDRVPRERPEHEQHRQQKEQRREPAAPHPGQRASAARGASTGFASSVLMRAGSRAFTCASMGSATDMRGSTVLRVVQGLGADARRPAPTAQPVVRCPG